MPSGGWKSINPHEKWGLELNAVMTGRNGGTGTFAPVEEPILPFKQQA